MRILIFVAALAVAATVAAQEGKPTYAKGMELHRAKNYTACAAIMSGLPDEPGSTFGETLAYNTSCCLALSGDRERALVAIRKAVEHPAFRDYKLLSTDPDLASLHGDPAWSDILALARQKSLSLLSKTTIRKNKSEPVSCSFLPTNATSSRPSRLKSPVTSVV